MNVPHKTSSISISTNLAFNLLILILGIPEVKVQWKINETKLNTKNEKTEYMPDAGAGANEETEQINEENEATDGNGGNGPKSPIKQTSRPRLLRQKRKILQLFVSRRRVGC